jgi:hypothetical protein
MYEPLSTYYPNHSLCRRLRAKSMFVEVEEPDPSVEGTYEGLVWCSHTQNCLGPDGQVADGDSCKPGRGCYEGY